jgi:hypothetical protein
VYWATLSSKANSGTLTITATGGTSVSGDNVNGAGSNSAHCQPANAVSAVQPSGYCSEKP